MCGAPAWDSGAERTMDSALRRSCALAMASRRCFSSTRSMSSSRPLNASKRLAGPAAAVGVSSVGVTTGAAGIASAGAVGAVGALSTRRGSSADASCASVLLPPPAGNVCLLMILDGCRARARWRG